MPGAYLEIHPEDARRAGISSGDLVEVESRRGSLRLPTCIVCGKIIELV